MTKPTQLHIHLAKNQISSGIRCVFTVKLLNFWTPENCCNLSEIQEKRTNLRVVCQKDANGIAKSLISGSVLFAQTCLSKN